MHPREVLFHVRHRMYPEKLYPVLSWGDYGVVIPDIITSNGSISHVVNWVESWCLRERSQPDGYDIVEPEWANLNKEELDAKIRSIHQAVCVADWEARKGRKK